MIGKISFLVLAMYVGVFNSHSQSVFRNEALLATIDITKEKQTIHSFGASDCWSIKFIGKNWPLAKRNQIADLLFSREYDKNGDPKGIGLSLWRINAGAGSFEQGEASRISSEWRREECFLNESGSNNWKKQAGNQWFAKAAKKRGVENLLLFSIAAPVHLSKNGLATGDTMPSELGKMNLLPNKFEAYADFLAEAAKYYATAGMPINYISPVNETNWNWVIGKNGYASQEGTSATNDEIFTLAKALNEKITAKGLKTNIALCESGSHDNTVSYVSSSPERSNFINYFWNPASKGYVGDFKNIEKVVSSHSYGAQSNVNNLIRFRTGIANKLDSLKNGVNYWQSEYCILSNEDGTQGSKRDLGINSALYLARVVHTDLVLGNATSWQWWLGVSPSDYKDGLVYITDLKGNMGELPATKMNGNILPSKMLWALGNFSRFVRPGMIRVDAVLEKYTNPLAAAKGLMISAYKNPTKKAIVVVVINMKETEESIKLSGIPYTGSRLKRYTTSATEEMAFSIVNPASSITVNPLSIVTLIGDYH